MVSPNVNLIVGKILANTRKGSFWCFASEKELEDIFDEIEQEQSIILIKKKGVVLCEIDPNFMIETAQEISNGTQYMQEDLTAIQQEMAKSVVSFERFLITKGKQKDHFAGAIGIYSVNASPSITYNGVNYPAFRLNMVKVLQLLKEYGYKIKVNSNYVTVDEALQDMTSLWKSVMFSPTHSGIFINIQSGLNSQEMEQKEKYYNQKYGN